MRDKRTLLATCKIIISGKLLMIESSLKKQRKTTTTRTLLLQWTGKLAAISISADEDKGSGKKHAAKRPIYRSLWIVFNGKFREGKRVTSEPYPQRTKNQKQPMTNQSTLESRKWKVGGGHCRKTNKQPAANQLPPPPHWLIATIGQLANEGTQSSANETPPPPQQQDVIVLLAC